MKILFVASEVAPLAKTGGLADVAGALPLALKTLGHDVRIIMPGYGSVLDKFKTEATPWSVQLLINGLWQEGQFRRTDLQGIPVYLLDHPGYFQREGLYGTAEGDYPDNGERFGFFCRAVIDLLPRLDFAPDAIHLNDWQTGLIPVLLRTERRYDPFFAATGTLFTIHNLGYQGLFGQPILGALGLNPALNTIDGLEYYGWISFLKGGILFSDIVTTVSPTYCREIQQPEQGLGFDGILRHCRHRLFGILNGLDTELWDPQHDAALAAPFHAGNLRGKTANKRALQKELGLSVTPGRPLLAMVTRLATQKGLDLLQDAWHDLLQRDLQLVILGTGERVYMDWLEARADSDPDRLAIRLSFDDGLARRIYAGSDLFLMPSHYEPCGLGQMIALRYGSLPLVRHTGGLADTVRDPELAPLQANGFSFMTTDSDAMLSALDRALTLFGDRKAWLKMVKCGMQEDFSWEQAAEQYLVHYRQARELRHVG